MEASELSWNLIWTIIASAFGGAVITSAVTILLHIRETQQEKSRWVHDQQSKVYVRMLEDYTNGQKAADALAHNNLGSAGWEEAIEAITAGHDPSSMLLASRETVQRASQHYESLVASARVFAAIGDERSQQNISAERHEEMAEKVRKERRKLQESRRQLVIAMRKDLGLGKFESSDFDLPNDQKDQEVLSRVATG